MTSYAANSLAALPEVKCNGYIIRIIIGSDREGLGLGLWLGIGLGLGSDRRSEPDFRSAI